MAPCMASRATWLVACNKVDEKVGCDGTQSRMDKWKPIITFCNHRAQACSPYRGEARRLWGRERDWAADLLARHAGIKRPRRKIAPTPKWEASGVVSRSLATQSERSATQS
eukprot:scaffold137823_cov28-Tisochrysis_lutea.AAC.1